MLFVLVFSFLLSRPSIQTVIGAKVTSTLNDSYNVGISVDQIRISVFGKLELTGVLIKDHHNDTLIAVSKLKTSLRKINTLLNNKLILGESELYDGVFHMKTYSGEDTNNLTVFSRKFTKDKKLESKPFRLNTPSISLHGINFDFIDLRKKKDSLVVFYNQINGKTEDFVLNGSSVSINLKNVKFLDNHGLHVENLTTEFSYTNSQMLFGKTCLETQNSKINADVVFNYTSEDLHDFNNKVQIEATVQDSDVSLIDLKKLYNEFGSNDLLKVSTKFKGTLNNFRLTHFDLNSGENFKIKGNYHFTDVVYRGDNFAMNGISEEITSDYQQLKALLPNLIGRNLPSELSKIGTFSISGATLVKKTLLDIAIDVKSVMGIATVDLELTNIDNIDEATYNGYVNVTDFELGKMVGDPLIGKLSFEGEVNGEGFKIENVNTSLIGIVSKHQYKDYTYRDIRIDGVLRNKLFNGHLVIDDPNISFDFTGLADFSSEIHKFDFNVKIDKFDLKKLNLFERDSISNVQGDIKIDLTGNTIDDIVGTASFTNASYTNEFEKHVFENFSLNSAFKDDVKTVNFNSNDIINGQLKGVFKLRDLGKLVQNSLGSMIANYTPIKTEGSQYLEFDFEIFNQIIPVLSPHLRLYSSAILKGKVIDENNEIKLLFKTPKVKVYNSILDSVSLQLDNKNPSLNTNLIVKQLKMSKYTMRDINVYNKTLNDTLFFRSDFTGGKENKERFGLVFYYTLDKEKNSVLGILESKILFKEKEWLINPSNNRNNKMIFDLSKQEYSFKEIELLTEGQEILFEGVIRDSTYKDLTMKFDKVNLDAIMPKIDSLSLNGVLDGNLNFKQENGIYNPLGNLSIKKFTINESLQGDLYMNVRAKDSYKKYKVDISLLNETSKKLDVTGLIDISPKIPTIDLDVTLDEFNLNAFSPLGKNVLSQIRGVASGKFKVEGNLSNPDMNGALALVNSGFTFPYLNVDYNIVENAKVVLKGQSFLFNNLVLEDSKYQTRGLLNGEIKHAYYKDWKLNLNINTDRLLILDTEDGDNVSYYGTGFIKGQSNIAGTTTNLVIDVKAKTLAGTKFVIPLNDVKGVENSSLIHFKSDNKNNFEKTIFSNQTLIEKFHGLSLNFDIEVTTDAEAEIVIDRTSGSSLKGFGKGNLLVEIDTKGKFNMFGDYNIDKGFYNFIYGGIINKPFEIKKGGLISWDGGPMDANLNLQAVHTVKANPKVLLTDLNTNRKIEVDLITDIRGTLFNSTEDFGIIIPNSSSTVASELSFVLNDDDENATLRQFFSLLITKSFFNEENSTSNGNSAITGTTSDIISGALSDVFNEDGDKIQIDLGYTAGEKNDIEDLNIDNQVDISLKTQINDKILIDGNLGVPVGTKTQSTVVGEVKVEFLVDDEGNLRYTVFNRQNEVQYSEEEEGYTQGVGLIYQVDFRNLKEMFSKFGFRRKKRNTFENVEKEYFPEDLILVVPSIL